MNTEEPEIIAEEKIEEVNEKINFFSWENVWKNLPFFLFLVGLSMIHIANNHLAVNQIRYTNKLEKELKEYRWEYLTTKSDLMYRSKQSEVVKVLEPLGFKELINPPYKIQIKEKEYQTKN